MFGRLSDPKLREAGVEAEQGGTCTRLAPASACRYAASPMTAHRLTGSGASAYYPYLPSTRPTVTSTGKTKRCTTVGISDM